MICATAPPRARERRRGALLASLVALLIIRDTTAGDEHSSWSISADGELRERFETADHPVFGLASPAHDDYLLHRLYLGVEIQNEQHFRARIETVSAATSGWKDEAPSTQDDPADILQAFVEGGFEAGGGRLKIRAGRQEIKLGSSRLVSVRDSANVRRVFDGLRASWSRGSTSVDAFYVRPVFPERGILDDSSSPAQEFWGLYTTLDLSRKSGIAADFYYLGLDRDDATFAVGRERERRHTVGARLFTDRAPWHVNLEGVWQWGSFDDRDIRAWTLSADLGYSLESLPGSPRLGFKADIISGDGNASDRKLGTFNPLFPRLSYFSEANVAAPANLMDVQPSVSFRPVQRFTATLAWNCLWKYAREDAFYAPPLAPQKGTADSGSRYIGQQLEIQGEWEATERLSFSASFVHFEPGDLVKNAGGRSGDFGTAWALYSF